MCLFLQNTTEDCPQSGKEYLATSQVWWSVLLLVCQKHTRRWPQAWGWARDVCQQQELIHGPTLCLCLSRIQQIQLLGRDMRGAEHDKLWNQLEAEIHLHRHKTVIRACRGRANRKKKLPTPPGHVSVQCRVKINSVFSPVCVCVCVCVCMSLCCVCVHAWVCEFNTDWIITAKVDILWLSLITFTGFSMILHSFLLLKFPVHFCSFCGSLSHLDFHVCPGFPVPQAAAWYGGGAQGDTEQRTRGRAGHVHYGQGSLLLHHLTALSSTLFFWPLASSVSSSFVFHLSNSIQLQQYEDSDTFSAYWVAYCFIQYNFIVKWQYSYTRNVLQCQVRSSHIHANHKNIVKLQQQQTDISLVFPQSIKLRLEVSRTLDMDYRIFNMCVSVIFLYACTHWMTSVYSLIQGTSQNLTLFCALHDYHSRTDGTHILVERRKLAFYAQQLWWLCQGNHTNREN